MLVTLLNAIHGTADLIVIYRIISNRKLIFMIPSVCYIFMTCRTMNTRIQRTEKTAVFTVFISCLILDYEMYSTDCKKTHWTGKGNRGFYLILLDKSKLHRVLASSSNCFFMGNLESRGIGTIIHTKNAIIYSSTNYIRFPIIY